MASSVGLWSKLVARAAAPIVVAASLSACSSVPDWVDPTTWIGSDSQASSEQAPSDNGTSDQAANDQSTPDLASVPAKPTPPSTADEQKQVADSLEADRARAHYSADALRGGTEPAAPAPAPAGPADATSSAAAPADTGAPTAPAPSSEQADSSAPAPSEAAAPAAAAAPASSPGPAEQTATAPVPAESTPPTQVASAEPAPAQTMASPTAAQSAPTPSTDGDLGFQPSKAPALDPSVAKFVPQPILDRYEQTAMTGSAPQTAAPAASGAMSDAAPPVKAKARHKKHAAAATADTPPDSTPASTNGLQPASFTPTTPTPSVYAGPSGQSPAAVVYFPHDTTILSGSARAQVQAAAEAFQAGGHKGYVRVVGHSSSRTPDMPLAEHMEYNFERSQARATAVARELIRDGVPADKVLVEAVGDTQPVYYESMPKGEEGNRRAEIFLQS